jgi:hypothetical protein
VGPIIGAIIGVWIFEGYLILMKKYANLPGITHIDAVEQPDQGKHYKKSRRIDTQISTESNCVFFFQIIFGNIFLFYHL